MKLVSNEKQKDNLANVLYDVAKIIIAIMVIGPIAKPESFNRIAFITGVLVSIAFIIIGQIFR